MALFLDRTARRDEIRNVVFGRRRHLIGVQTIVNIASMIGLMPMTGVTLLLVSYGNSSLVSLAGLGVVASVQKRSSSHAI